MKVGFNIALTVAVMLLVAIAVDTFLIKPPEEVPDPDPPYMATWEVDVAASGDDCKETNTGTVTLTGYMEMNGQVITYFQYMGVRFINSPIPQGSTINSAILQVSIRNMSCGGVGDCGMIVNGIDEDNPAAFSSTNKCSGRALTTAGSVVDDLFLGTLGDQSCNVEPRFFDLTTMLQEIVDRAGYADGNAVAFVFTRDIWTDQFDFIRLFDVDNSCPSHLSVDYTAPTPPATGSSRAMTQNNNGDPLAVYGLE